MSVIWGHVELVVNQNVVFLSRRRAGGQHLVHAAPSALWEWVSGF